MRGKRGRLGQKEKGWRGRMFPEVLGSRGTVGGRGPQPHLCGHHTPEAGGCAFQEQTSDQQAEDEDVGEEYRENQALASGSGQKPEVRSGGEEGGQGSGSGEEPVSSAHCWPRVRPEGALRGSF